MPDITDILPVSRRNDLAFAFSSSDMDTLLAAKLPAASPNSQQYIAAITAAFAAQLPADLASGPRTRLSEHDRERVLIALLASRSERLNLAIHIYYAIGLAIALPEILHILLLAGVYTGLPNFANALNVAAETFKLLADPLLSDLKPAKVVQRLLEAFDLPPPG